VAIHFHSPIRLHVVVSIHRDNFIFTLPSSGPGIIAFLLLFIQPNNLNIMRWPTRNCVRLHCLISFGKPGAPPTELQS
jgi:hypothetical protein